MVESKEPGQAVSADVAEILVKSGLMRAYVHVIDRLLPSFLVSRL